MTTSHLRFWAKTPDGQPGHAYHPVAYHLIDVASVCAELLRADPTLARDLARLTGSTVAEAIRLIVLLAAVHDLGKFSRAFQAKVRELWPDLFGPYPDPVPGGTAANHQMVGHATFSRHLPHARGRILGSMGGDGGFEALASAVFHHHGRPLPRTDVPRELIGDAAIEAARACVDDVVDALTHDEGEAHRPFPGSCDEADLAPLSWRVAGLVTLADWLGSNQAYFPCVAPTLSVRDYHRLRAVPAARRIVREAGLLPQPLSPVTGYAALTGDVRTPSPMQDWAGTTDLPLAGSLVLIEDATASGKTAAAFVVSHRAMLQGAGAGVYVGLPTMATANDAYGRFSGMHRRLYADGAEPSLVLAHGQRRSNATFMRSVLRDGASPRAGGGAVGPSCAAWLADGSRRALFAHVGVGTVDQALLAVLPAKFAALRQLALAGRVLVVDEAHAYDAYVGEELAGLVEFHAAMGGTTVILSATLPATVRDRLARAHANGRGIRYRPAPWPSSYPCATVCGPDGTRTSVPVLPRPDLVRSVPVRRVGSVAEALARIAEASRAGACVAYVRNSVREAREAHAALVAMGVDAVLFHSRFAACDRARIDAELSARFGPDGDAEGRRGRVVVATQVIEQGVDHDYDLVVTDLAPIDLLIQRIGRLWRHDRGPRPVPCECLVVSPDPDGDVAADWVSSLLPGGARVYADHAVLWRSARTLFGAGRLDSPGLEGAPTSVRAMVEAVYGPDGMVGVPGALARSRKRSEDRRDRDASMACGNVLRAEEGYGGDLAGWDVDERVPTRLGLPQVRVRLARLSDGRVLPWSADDPEAWPASWHGSEVTVPRRFAARAPLADVAAETAALGVETAMAKGAGDRVLLPMRPVPDVDGRWTARVTTQDGRTLTVSYSAVDGFDVV